MEHELKSYFKRPDTPAEGSPVGRLMFRILDKKPHLTPDQARAEANEMLQQAAGRRVYQLPPVLTPELEAAQKARFAAWAVKKASKTVGFRDSSLCVEGKVAA